MGGTPIFQTAVEATKRWEDSRCLKLSNSNICRRMNLGIIIRKGEILDSSSVILQSIPICLRYIPTKDLKTK